MSRHPVRQGASEVDAVVASATYCELIERLKQRIRESQARAARAVNTELVMLYWSIGRDILDQQQAGGWGDDVVGRIAQDLSADTGSARGFSRRNLFYMRRFAALWPEREKVPSVMAQIAWTSHRVLMDRFDRCRVGRAGRWQDHDRSSSGRGGGEAGFAGAALGG